MAIIQSHHTINGRDFIRTVSDENRFVVRDGVNYEEAYDPVEYQREYTEGDKIQNEATAEDYEVALNKLGVEI